MSLEHALLVSLAEQPGSGYELARRFDRSIGYFWQATHQQIYKVLGRMETAGWLDVRTLGRGRQDKKVYAVNPAGHDEILRWMGQPGDLEILRSTLAVKIRAAAFTDSPELPGEIARHRAMHAERLAVYLDMERRDFAAPETLDRRGRVHHVLLRGGILAERFFLDWLDEVVQALQLPTTTSGVNL
ncbi:PadR family transcriptional regulator [Pseudonocardiaceae bacterium YIM PH 21723]|nr:PadR family transcriptional regulator [Pseudonocardiaceae bacterium YIM PH 21723]